MACFFTATPCKHVEMWNMSEQQQLKVNGKELKITILKMISTRNIKMSNIHKGCITHLTQLEEKICLIDIY